MKKILDVLDKLDDNRMDHPPQVVRKSENHVIVRGDGEELEEDFKSSGDEDT